MARLDSVNRANKALLRERRASFELGVLAKIAELWGLNPPRALCAQEPLDTKSSGSLTPECEGNPLLRERRLGDLNPGWA